MTLRISAGWSQGCGVCSAPQGLFFARLASTIGLEGFENAARGERVRLPDGSDRFVVDEAMLLDWTARLGGSLAYPLKMTNVAPDALHDNVVRLSVSGAKATGPTLRRQEISRSRHDRKGSPLCLTSVNRFR